MKSYTDLEQSKKLAEMLPIESANMCYIKHASSDNPNWEFNEDFSPMILGNVPINEITAETLPCWSLAALLRLMPKRYYEGEVYIPLVGKYYEGNRTFICGYFGGGLLDCTLGETSVDACYEMILKLHGLNLL